MLTAYSGVNLAQPQKVKFTPLYALTGMKFTFYIQKQVYRIIYMLYACYIEKSYINLGGFIYDWRETQAIT